MPSFVFVPESVGETGNVLPLSLSRSVFLFSLYWFCPFKMQDKQLKVTKTEKMKY